MVVRLYRRERKIQLEKDQLKIIGALSSEYVDVFLADLRTDVSTTIKSEGKMIPSDKRVDHSYSKTWEYFLNTIVLEEDNEHIAKPLNLVGTGYLCARQKEGYLTKDIRKKSRE